MAQYYNEKCEQHREKGSQRQSAAEPYDKSHFKRSSALFGAQSYH